MGNVSKIVCKWFQTEKNTDKLNENFTKIYDADSDRGHILEVDIEYPENFLNLHGDLPFLAEREN